MKKHGHPKFYQILEEMAQLHSDKNHDYAESDRPLGNFERVADLVDKYNLFYECDWDWQRDESGRVG